MIGKELSVIPAPIKRGKELKKVHAQDGISDEVFVYNKFVLPESDPKVQKLQKDIAQAYDTFNKDVSELFVSTVGEAQFSTAFELSKQNAIENPFPASMQSAAHKQNLTDDGIVAVWAVDKGTVSTSKENLASGLSL